MAAMFCLFPENNMICQTHAPACRCWKSCSALRPPALITSFAEPAPNAFESAPHDCLTDEASQPTGLTTPVLRECFHGNRLRSCEEKQKTERERQTGAKRQRRGCSHFSLLSCLFLNCTFATRKTTSLGKWVCNLLTVTCTQGVANILEIDNKSPVLRKDRLS